MKTNHEYNFAELSNGIRLIHKNSNSPIVHIGFFIDAGSRDETEQELGMAHFIEHVVFKGTQKRKSYQIFNCIENVGGELNAFTTKEDTCIHASITKEYFEKAAELISDVAFNSIFPEEELSKEKDIIVDEIFYYKDIPEELIFDEFEEMVFAGHSLGRNILGNPAIIKKFTKKDIYSFIQRNYTPNNMVISVVGDIEFSKITQVIKKHFEVAFSKSEKTSIRKAFASYKPSIKNIPKKIFQSHCIMGNVAYSHFNKHKVGLTLLNNLLGGPASNAILNMSVREKHGLTYNIESNYAPYFDTGIFSIYVSADNGSLDKAVRLINKELKTLRDHKMGVLQLSRAKKQLIGNLALSFESKISEMLSIGKTCMIFNQVDTIEDINKKIEKITAEELLQISNEIFDVNRFTQLIYQSNESYRTEDI
ncbi:MAG: pitrilysin family protein [Bacteroidota bacterium]